MALKKLMGLIACYGHGKTKRKSRSRLIVADPTNIKPKPTKIHELEIPDDVLHNIFSRLSVKLLLRFRCVSTHWNGLISDPYFIKSISRPKILLCGPRLHALDDKAFTIINLPFPFENPLIVVVGTFNGIVLLVNQTSHCSELILYNPFTRASKRLPDPPTHYRCEISSDVFGLAYGANPDDLKIFIGRARYVKPYHPYWCDCHVFNLKKGSWTTSKDTFLNLNIDTGVGVFLNGFLHWNCTHSHQVEIAALDVKEMVVTRMNGPPQSCYMTYVMGTLHGRLCMTNNRGNEFSVWVMKEHGVDESWSKEYSFTFGSEYDYFDLETSCILEDGRIGVRSGSDHIVICDLNKGSYNVFRIGCNMWHAIYGIEYVESMVSPLYICQSLI